MLKQLIIIFCASCLVLSACSPQKKEEAIAVKPLFRSHEALELRIQMPIEQVRTDIGEDRLWHKASLFWNQQKINIQVRTRGNFRRDPDNCNFPPLYISFDSATALNTPFEGYEKIRMVSHCQLDSPLYEQIVLEEYNIYRTYQLFTDKSAGARLCRITYEDSQNPQYTIPSFAFFVEGTDYLAKDLGAKHLAQADSVHYLDCNSFFSIQLALFQFMVGNADWSVSYKHNLNVLEFEDQGYVPVPFDFDFSGIINAPYTGPDPELGIESVRERVFRGYCQSEAELRLVLEQFKSKEQEVMDCWKNLPYHAPDRKKQSLEYLQSFYQIIHNEDSVNHYFLQQCR